MCSQEHGKDDFREGSNRKERREFRQSQHRSRLAICQRFPKIKSVLNRHVSVCMCVIVFCSNPEKHVFSNEVHLSI